MDNIIRSTEPTMGGTEMEHNEAFEKIGRLKDSLSSVIRGKPAIVDLAITALFAGGHLLIEDVPGVGKTTLAHGLARSINCSFQRIQFTSDLLPSDVIGVTVYNQNTHSFEFRPGPIFANIVLADEINRATPKTQSALLEAMNDRQVSVEKVSHPLPEPFMLLATQNPLEFSGTFPLPESQLDRFTMALHMGYPDLSHEIEILKSTTADLHPDSLSPVISASEVIDIQRLAATVTVDDDLASYILAIAGRTRSHGEIRLGVSPRGTKTLYRTAQAYALVKGRTYCIPDDIKELSAPVFAHRIIPAAATIEEASEDAAAIIEEIVSEVTVPV